MSDQSTTIVQELDQSPEAVFAAVTDVRGWWSRNIEGGTAAEGDEFVYEVPDVHRCRMRLTEVVPHERVTWLVVENSFSFVEDQQEWLDTEVRFEIAAAPGGKTVLRFTHVGLVPEFECFEICHRSWDFYVGHSLRRLIVTGRGLPNEREDDVVAVGARIDATLG
jgi:uncharacterized protein YndB with AHSA1/START domain